MLRDNTAQIAEPSADARTERRVPPRDRPQGLDSLRAEVQRKLAQQIDLGVPDPIPPPREVDSTFRPAAERQRMASLRAEATRHMTVRAAPERQGLFGRAGHGRKLKASRLALIVVAILAGGLAAWLATGRGTPAPQPVIHAAPQPAPAAVQIPTVQVLIAKEGIGAGQRLSADQLEWSDWPKKDVRPEYVTKTAEPDAMQHMSGDMARLAILAGEPIRSDKLAGAGEGYLSAVLAPGMRAVSVSVTPEAASGGFIVPSDHVDVVVTRNTNAGSVSDTVVQNALVLAIGKTIAPPGSTPNGGDMPANSGPKQGGAAADGFSSAALATLALDAQQAQVMISAASTGRLSLVLRPSSGTTDAAEAQRQAANAAIRLTSPFWTSGSGNAPQALR